MSVQVLVCKFTTQNKIKSSCILFVCHTFILFDPQDLNDIETTPIYDVNYTLARANSGPFRFRVARTEKNINPSIHQQPHDHHINESNCLIKKSIYAVPLVLDVIFRQNFIQNYLDSNPILSQTKLWAEGILSYKQIILGWLMDTRSIKLIITKDKVKQILIVLKKRFKWQKVKNQFLEKRMIGSKLTDISFLVQEGRLFLN